MLTDLSFADPATIRHRCMTELVVWVEEEYGYRQWIWFPKCSPTELARRWRTTQRMGLNPPLACLWGDWLDVLDGPHWETERLLWADFDCREARWRGSHFYASSHVQGARHASKRASAD